MFICLSFRLFELFLSGYISWCAHVRVRVRVRARVRVRVCTYDCNVPACGMTGKCFGVCGSQHPVNWIL